MDLVRLLVGLILGFIAAAVVDSLPHVSYPVAVLVGVLVFVVITFSSRIRF